MLKIDPTACAGIGLCAHLAPDLVTLDSWGYPMVTVDRVLSDVRRPAEAAVRACPRRAMFLDHAP